MMLWKFAELKIIKCNFLSCNVCSQLGQQVTVGDGCVVSVFCVLDKEDHLDNMTVVYGPGNQRRKQQDKPMVCHFLVLGFVVVRFSDRLFSTCLDIIDVKNFRLAAV